MMTPQQFVEMVARFTPTGEDDEDNKATLARLIDEASTIVSDLPPPAGDVGELIAWLRFHGQNDPAHDDDAPQNIAAKRQREAAAEIERLRAQVAALRSALEKLIAACDAGRPFERGSGGMTIDAQLARTVINGVRASAVEDARAALAGEPTND
jgi:hypothetical protein